MMRTSVIVTGASGFIGMRLSEILREDGRDVIPISRSSSQQNLALAIDLSLQSIPDKFLQLTQTIVHCAGRAHKTKGQRSSDTCTYHFRDNHEATRRLAADAARCGVSRFVYLSTIGVNGITNNQPFTETDPAQPIGAYATSKFDAERALLDIQKETGMEIVIVRVPLVYGPNAPGNFGRLIKALDKGLPLPLGSVDNLRSFIALDNLIDFLTLCINHPSAANELFLVSDGKDLSTTEFLHLAINAAGSSTRLFSVPTRLLKATLVLLGRRDMAASLLGSLRIDASKAQQLLGWKPSLNVEEGLIKALT